MNSVVSPKSIVRALPTHLDLPYEDDSVPHNFFENDQGRLLTSVIELWFKQRRPGYKYIIGQDSYIYWDITSPPTLGAKAPDWFLIEGVAPLLDGVMRNSYVLWQEHVRPTIVMDFVSETPGGEWDKTPRTGKFWAYEQGICAPQYVIFDPFHDHMDPYQLVEGRYQQPQPNERGHYPIESLGLEFGLWHGVWHNISRLWIRFWDSNGQLLPTHEEAGDRDRMLAEQADRERAKAFAKLRELGFDPEKL